MALRVLHGWKDLRPGDRGAALALGNFDGVHRGHWQVIADAARAAGRMQIPLGVISFDPHPRKWFRPDEPAFRLTTADQQGRVLEGLGVDRLHILAFDAEMANLGDEAFARQVLAEGLGARHVAAGFDITFGRGRSGDPESLRRYGARHGFGVSIAAAVAGGGGLKFSSTAVRAALRDAQPEAAAAILGRPFAIEGVVVRGDGLGRRLGFPTAGISLEDYVRPAFGVYAAWTRLADGREAPGVGHVGPRPGPAEAMDARLDVHLFDVDEDLYGQTLEVDLVHFVRPDRRFPDQDAMTAQMRLDVQAVRDRLIPEIDL